MTNNLNINPMSVQLDEIVDPDHYRATMIEGFLPPSDEPGSTACADEAEP